MTMTPKKECIPFTAPQTPGQLLSMPEEEYISYHMAHCQREAKRHKRIGENHRGRGAYKSQSAHARRRVCARKHWRDYQENGVPDTWKPKDPA